MNSDNLRELREDLRMSQEDMGNLLNIKQSTYSDYENNRSIIPLERLNIISNKFNASLDYLVGLSRSNSDSFDHIEIDFIKIGNRLKEIRTENNLTQEAIAKMLNTFHSRISDYENGKRITIPVLIEYSRVFNKSIDYLCLKK